MEALRNEYQEKTQRYFKQFQSNPGLWQIELSYKMSDVPKLSLEALAETADYVCKQMHQNERQELWYLFCREQFPLETIRSLPAREANATMFGAIALRVLKGPPEDRVAFKKLLDQKIEELRRILEDNPDAFAEDEKFNNCLIS